MKSHHLKSILFTEMLVIFCHQIKIRFQSYLNTGIVVAQWLPQKMYNNNNNNFFQYIHDNKENMRTYIAQKKN